MTLEAPEKTKSPSDDLIFQLRVGARENVLQVMTLGTLGPVDAFECYLLFWGIDPSVGKDSYGLWKNDGWMNRYEAGVLKIYREYTSFWSCEEATGYDDHAQRLESKILSEYKDYQAQQQRIRLKKEILIQERECERLIRDMRGW